MILGMTASTFTLVHIEHLTPGLVLGVLSLAVLTFTVLARYAFGMSGAWRRTYMISAAIALYFNVFVAVVQAFAKLPALKALALVAQLVVLDAFVALTVPAAKRFHGEPLRVASSA
jgi:hypothetical protein